MSGQTEEAGKVVSFGAKKAQREEDVAEELRLLGVPALSDAGNAERLAATLSSSFRFVPGPDEWLTDDGRRWVKDVRAAQVTLKAIDCARMIRSEAWCASSKAQLEVAKHALRSEDEHRLRAAVSLAQKMPPIPVMPEELDRDPDFLNVLNGTVDLRTGRLLGHGRERLLTKLAPVAFDSAAAAPTWDRFLATVLPDAEVREYVRRAVGYSLTGNVSEHVLLFLYGSGANGKSTFIEVCREILGEGEYAKTASPELLLAKKQDRHQEEMAELRGARFVTTVEMGENRSWDEARVKWLTGGDTISARFLFGNRFSFQPTHKLWVAANHRPRVRGTDNGFWRRVHLVPFTVTIPEEQRDPNLRAKLRAELPGILRWAVEGCLEWRKSGLKPPAAVRAATEEYRSKEDVLAAFLDECCIVNAAAFATVAQLYDAFKRWAEESGEFVPTKRAFTDSIEERPGIARGRGTGGVRRLNGIGLKSNGGGE